MSVLICDLLMLLLLLGCNLLLHNLLRIYILGLATGSFLESFGLVDSSLYYLVKLIHDCFCGENLLKNTIFGAKVVSCQDTRSAQTTTNTVLFTERWTCIESVARLLEGMNPIFRLRGGVLELEVLRVAGMSVDQRRCNSIRLCLERIILFWLSLGCHHLICR